LQGLFAGISLHVNIKTICRLEHWGAAIPTYIYRVTAIKSRG
jgi:hypothetical protein